MNIPPPLPIEVVRIPLKSMSQQFMRVLTRQGFSQEKAEQCATIFAENSLDGVHTHGVDRFARFIRYVKEGHITIHAEPAKQHGNGAVEQWDGGFGPGILNALKCTERAIELSKEFGIGCIALRNTNHWMRGGTYAWKAAKGGFLFIGWTNTIANMPAWGAVDSHLGNNPFVIGVPYKNEAIVLDMAMSQFSYGTMESHQRQGKNLAVPGGYDAGGKLTTDPADILHSQRILPIGYWKGAGFALLLDLFASVLSGGLSTAEISKQGVERGLSQVFVAFDIAKLSHHAMIANIVNSILFDYKNSTPESGLHEVLYPGERALRMRIENIKDGIPVDRAIWEEIQTLDVPL
jgi:3-dehydro-L-gulonate 2-dehydrogenase